MIIKEGPSRVQSFAPPFTLGNGEEGGGGGRGGLGGAPEKAREDRRWRDGGGVFQKGLSLSVRT